MEKGMFVLLLLPVECVYIYICVCLCVCTHKYLLNIMHYKIIKYNKIKI